MESNKEEALRAKENAKKLFAEKNYVGAKSFALKAQTFYPELEGISQMVATFEVYIASEAKINGETNFYSILGLHPSANMAKLKKQYKKMAALLHPDKNKSVGADGAFQLVLEAWTLLSDSNKRSSYDLRRTNQLSSVHIGGTTGFNYSSNSTVSHTRLDTFWTVCTSCQIQYEYLRKYLNKRLSCKNCRGVFIAVETGAPPVSGSFPYCPWPSVPDNGYNGHLPNGVTYVPNAAICYNGNGVSAFQWNSYHGASGVVAPNGFTVNSGYDIPRGNGNIKGRKANGRTHMKSTVVDVHVGPKVLTGYNEPKKRKVDVGGTSQNRNQAMAKTEDVRVVNGNGNTKQNSKLLNQNEIPTRTCSAAPAFDARKLLIDKARTEIRKKLEEIRLASIEKNKKVDIVSGNSIEGPTKAGLGGSGNHSELKKVGSMSITVPDSDFHDFDKDRAEECFKPKQIWALYDEDGMPRLYCLIRQVISVNPFKIHITYLNSKTDSEFGLVNWLDSGFTKSLGNFRAWHSETVDQVNIFSHLLKREKAGRGGCVRIYPKSGDIWALYRNWSPDWNRMTPDNVKNQYEMVEVLDDYSEELGVCVAPLVKLDRYKTVYQRNTNKDAVRWIPRREMLRFSHQVPSSLLEGHSQNLPDGCWDLDPAATPEELLQAVTEVKAEEEQLSLDEK